MDTMKNDLYAKKISFKRITNIDTLSKTHYSYLYDYGVTGDDMIQITKEKKQDLLTTFNESHSIYAIKEEYVPVEPNQIDIVEQSAMPNNWSYVDRPINELTEWCCIGNTEWENYDKHNRLHETGFHSDWLYRKDCDNFIIVPSYKCY